MTRPRTALLALLIGAASVAPAFEIGRLLERWIDPRASWIAIPLLLALPIQPLFRGCVEQRRYRRAAIAAMLWALGATLVAVPLVAATGDRYADAIWQARSYRDSMFEWVRTGIGEESSPARFLPKHALHFAAFCVLSFATYGFLGLALGAALLAYMNFYVGSLLAHAARPLAIAGYVWPVYAIVRVAGFILVAVALTAYALRWRRGIPLDARWARRVLLAGIGLVALDAMLKTLLASHYSMLLRGG